MVHISNVCHQYTSSTTIQFPDFDIGRGEHWLIIGISGSGKTTMLHILAGLLTPTNGKVIINDTDIYKKKESERDRFRGRNIGVIFQRLHLLSTLTVLENVMLAQYMAGMPQDRVRIEQLLTELDIAEKAHAYPRELSFGQAQRAGIARAVVNNPVLLLADEPTSNLDDVRSGQVLDLLEKQAEAHNASLVIATHDQRVKDRFTEYIDLPQPEKDRKAYLTLL